MSLLAKVVLLGESTRPLAPATTDPPPTPAVGTFRFKVSGVGVSFRDVWAGEGCLPALSNSLEAATAAVGDFDFNIGFGSLALEKNENSFCWPLICFFEEPRLLIVVLRCDFNACGTEKH